MRADDAAWYGWHVLMDLVDHSCFAWLDCKGDSLAKPEEMHHKWGFLLSCKDQCQVSPREGTL